MIGSFMYLAVGTRPDIIYTIIYTVFLSQFNSCFSKKHGNVNKMYSEIFKQYNKSWICVQKKQIKYCYVDAD